MRKSGQIFTEDHKVHEDRHFEQEGSKVQIFSDSRAEE
jgi:hypothetical protein